MEARAYQKEARSSQVYQGAKQLEVRTSQVGESASQVEERLGQGVEDASYPRHARRRGVACFAVLWRSQVAWLDAQRPVCRRV